MKKVLLAIGILVITNGAQADSQQTMNALNMTGGATADFIRLERCTDGTIAATNDYDELLRQGQTSPCLANAATSNGKIKNVGSTKFNVEYSFQTNSAYVQFNNIGDGFHLMYTVAAPGTVTAAEKEFVSAIHKCLLLLKNKLAVEFSARASNKMVYCISR